MTAVIPLLGVECHVCGQRADWWIDGVTLPCRCGARTRADVDHAVNAVRAWPDSDAERIREVARRRRGWGGSALALDEEFDYEEAEFVLAGAID